MQCENLLQHFIESQTLCWNHLRWIAKISWRYVIQRLSCYKWKIFSVAVLTVNFDLDLYKKNWQRRGTSAKSHYNWTTFREITKSIMNQQRTNKPSNEQTNQQTLACPIAISPYCGMRTVFCGVQGGTTLTTVWFGKPHTLKRELLSDDLCYLQL